MKSIFRHRRALSILTALASLPLLVACAAQSPAQEGNVGERGPIAPVSQTSGGPVGESRGMGSQLSTGGGYSGGFAAVEDPRTGISVTGSGKASAAPDLAVLNLGIESFAPSVAEARDQAASAMDQVVKVILAGGVAEKDVQTQYFNISPRYTSREVTRCPEGSRTGCFQTYEQIITGYQVNNQVMVRVRALDSVGSLIDQVTAAGGDLIRFQGIQFKVEDTRALEVEARQAAVQDLMNKAGQIAQLAGVGLGRPVFISEVSSTSPIPVAMAERAFFAADAVQTPVLTGEEEVVVTLQAHFSIQ